MRESEGAEQRLTTSRRGAAAERRDAVNSCAGRWSRAGRCWREEAAQSEKRGERASYVGTETWRRGKLGSGDEGGRGERQRRTDTENGRERERERALAKGGEEEESAGRREREREEHLQESTES